MAKISPVSIKYMIHANFEAEGALEKPDVIGALFGQTEGLLGSDLEMRELQKEGKIGRIEVSLERKGKTTIGSINIPTALDQSETTLIAAAIETIERIGPCDSQIEVERIEDVRGSKRDYIIERAKKLMGEIKGSTDSREISNEIKDAAKIAGIKEYGKEKLSCGDISEKELIVVEGRADVLNLMRNGVNNVISMNGTKLPESIKELGNEKELTLFIDGDRGGRLIAQNVVDNAVVKYIAIAPDGKEVEELTGKEILMNLRKRIPVNEFFPNNKSNNYSEEKPVQKIDLSDENKEKLKEISLKIQGTDKAVFLNDALESIKEVSVSRLNGILRRTSEKPAIIVIDGTVTSSIINAAEDAKCKVIVAKNFATTDTNIKLLSL
ncbi:MAG: DNA primase [Nanoarchaeota archaeon]|nr:DNA primase [Nanoarchaeota archaeon]MBU4116413.1 DNA primase [Nanoarchaeota archaeon]